MDALTTQTNKCKNCGAELEQVNNGTVKCDYCGSTFTAHLPEQASHNIINNENHENTTPDEPQNDTLTWGDVNGATLPNDYSFLVPDKKKLFKKYVLRGMLIWLIYGIVRAALPQMFGRNFEVDSSYYNNLIISPICGMYWFVRAAIFILIFPALMSTVFNKAGNAGVR